MEMLASLAVFSHDKGHMIFWFHSVFVSLVSGSWWCDWIEGRPRISGSSGESAWLK